MLWLVACSGLSGLGGGSGTDVVEVWVEPAEVTLYTTDGQPQEVQLEAWARFEDGLESTITLVSWGSSNLSAGDVDASGLFTSVDTNGGVTEVSANHLGISGSARITVVYTGSVLGPGADEALLAAFEAAEVTEGDWPTIDYPADQVRVPRNLEGLGFAWSAGDFDQASRIRLRSEITDISVVVAGSSQWVSTAALWEQIAAANRNGEVEVSVESGSWDGTTLSDVRRGPAITLTVNRLDADGSVLYWSSLDRGIMRIPVGETTSEAFWSGKSDNTCIGCHAVAESVDRMVVTHDGINGVFSVVNIANPDAPSVTVESNDSERYTFKTTSPDGRYILGSVFGELKLYELSTGKLVRRYTELAGYRLTQPDWSPDGETIVAVSVKGRDDEFHFDGGEIVLIPWNNGELGTPETLVPYSAQWNYYYPAWSPDGEWIAYNRTEGSGYASRKAQLFLVKPDGTVNVELTVANGVGELQNSYPRWGPLPDDEVLWLAFSSRRGYALADYGYPQIWVSAIDVEKAAAGEDPSSAPFWLPGQSPNSDNHLPYWWSR